jgi:hypothetical protein
MKQILSLILVMLFTVCTAKEINITNTGISFIAPDEFKPLSQELIDIKWPQKRAPKWVIGNASGTTTIAYDLKANDISNIPLPDLVAYFKKTFTRVIPGIEWKKSEIIELSGKRWGYLEMTSNAIDSDIYNIMLFTSFGKKMLIFNFNSTKDDFPNYESSLRNSVKTINLPTN